MFLGVRLQCAKCHNHPFDRWTQADYHSLAAFFVRVDYRIVENNRSDKLDKHEFDGEQIVYEARTGEAIHPRTGETLPPRFLGAETPAFAPDADRLQALADWVAAPDNPFFASAQVNRVWRDLLGRGIVDPDDDFRASNPPVNGPLLDALAKDFAGSPIRPAPSGADDHEFAHLSALRRPQRDEPRRRDQLLARAGAAVAGGATARRAGPGDGGAAKFPGLEPGLRAGQLPGVKTGRRQGDGRRRASSWRRSASRCGR